MFKLPEVRAVVWSTLLLFYLVEGFLLMTSSYYRFNFGTLFRCPTQHIFTHEIYTAVSILEGSYYNLYCLIKKLKLTGITHKGPTLKWWSKLVNHFGCLSSLTPPTEILKPDKHFCIVAAQEMRDRISEGSVAYQQTKLGIKS